MSTFLSPVLQMCGNCEAIALINCKRQCHVKGNWVVMEIIKRLVLIILFCLVRMQQSAVM